MKKIRINHVEETYYECPGCHNEYPYARDISHCDKCGKEWCDTCQKDIAYNFGIESKVPGGQRWEHQRSYFVPVYGALSIQELKDYVHLCAGCAQELQNTLSTFGLRTGKDINQEIKERRQAIKEQNRLEEFVLDRLARINAAEK